MTLLDDINKSTTIEQLQSLVPVTNCIGKCFQYCTQWVASKEEISKLPRIEPKGILCPFLKADGRCGEYKKKPLICSIWGSDQNYCQYGCKPSYRLSKEEADAILKRSYEIGGGVDSLWFSNDKCVVCNDFVEPMAIIHQECARNVLTLSRIEFAKLNRQEQEQSTIDNSHDVCGDCDHPHGGTDWCEFDSGSHGVTGNESYECGCQIFKEK